MPAFARLVLGLMRTGGMDREGARMANMLANMRVARGLRRRRGINLEVSCAWYVGPQELMPRTTSDNARRYSFLSR